MSISTPGAYGLIFRKSAKTSAEIDRRINEDLCRFPDMTPEDIHQDEHLYGCRIAMNWMDAERQVRELQAHGWVLGEDFVPTEGDDIAGKFPSWLEMTLAPTGNPPELEAKMTPEVRQMWERSRTKLYSMKQPSGAATKEM